MRSGSGPGWPASGYDPAAMTDPSRDRPERHVIVVADGDVPGRAALDAAWPGWARDVAEVIAADGGLARARAIGLEPGLLVGDLDSLPAEAAASAEAAGVEVRRSPVDKDESDTELALLEAVRRGATRITVLGAFGGPRLDHALANLWLLGHPALDGVDVRLLDATTRASVDPRAGDALACRGPSVARSRCSRWAATPRGSPPPGSATRCATRPCGRARPAACRTSARTPPPR